MSIVVLRKGMRVNSMNYGNLMGYCLSTIQVLIAVVYAFQGQGWKAANYIGGAIAIFSVTRM